LINKLPIVLQAEHSECGLACASMIASFYGHETDLNTLRRNEGLSSTGINLKNLIGIADSLCFTSRPIKLELEDLSKLKTPCILHWELNHFVVLKSANEKEVVIHDPAKGVRHLTRNEVSKRFTGIALELTPTSEFRKKKTVKKVSLSSFWGNIFGLKRVIIQLFLLSALLQIFALASPFYLQLSMDEVIVSEDKSLLVLLAFGFGFLVILNIFTVFLRGRMILFLGTQLNAQIAANILRHLLRLPMNYFERRHIGDIVSRFGSLRNIKDILTTGIIEVSVDGIMSIGLIVMMFIYSPALSWIVLATVFLYAIARLAFFNPYKRVNEELIVTHAKQSSNFMETIRGIQSIKLYGNEAQRQAVWNNYYADSLNANIKVGKLGLLYGFIGGGLFGIENILIVYFGIGEIMNNTLSVGMIFAYMAYKLQFTNASVAVIDKIVEFKMLSLHLERLGDIVLTEKEQNIGNENNTLSVSGIIEMKNITFRYSKGEPYILNKADLKIKQGSSLAIIGSSGEGKTTLLKILLGLLVPEEGDIKIDGIDIKTLGLKKYRKLIATVMQNDELFSGSIGENICFFEPNYNQDLIEESAKKASIHDDILKMPMGYHTLIGDMGSSLSGGQKQRVLLARALYKKPLLLFLDEATSHLDIKLESLINKTVKQLKITRVIIAHRQETIAMADFVLELKNGKLTKIR